MEIDLYSVPKDREGEMLKKFLERNKLPFKEIVTDDISVLRKIVQEAPCDKKSLLRIRYSHSINIIHRFNPFALKQLLEHIEKYNPKIEEDF